MARLAKAGGAEGDAAKSPVDRELRIMKIQYFFLVAIVTFVLSGCANQKETMVTTTDQTEKRVHTQEELLKTGETQTGPALEKTDAAIQTSHRP
jgi:PBP1b-binding outer membrane lipoprotein LpoB